ncbi:MAG: hypothetical protein ABW133_18330 [Polyangiaceae bacterium]
MKTRAWTAVATLAIGISACGSSTDEGLAEPQSPPDIDYKTDFVPGNPNFKRSPHLDVDIQSTTAEFFSHNMGENCFKCHQEHGPGRGRFTLAGTLYTPDNKPFPNATLKLYARADVVDGATIVSDEVLSLPLDGRGNFYTTTPLPGGYPSNKLFPRFFGPGGEPLIGPDNVLPAQMNGGITMGSCNYCHNAAMRVRGQIL